MKVLIVVDKSGTAIDRLAQLVQTNAPHLDIRILPVHPKRNDADTLYEASQLLQWCDLIDIHYWKSGEVLRQSFPQYFSKPKILFHFNPYDVDKLDWPKFYDKIIVGNKEIHEKIPYAHLVPYALDLSFFTFRPDDQYVETKVINMSVNRIESKKGVLEVAQVCKKLGYELHLVGRVSDGQYMQTVLDTGVVKFWENATDEELKNVYNNSIIHVCNSTDNFESGTLPILENMACGTPVLTRNVGHVPDLYNGGNMVVRTGLKEDLEDLETQLKDMVENRVWRLQIREKAWETVKNRDARIMTRRITKLYYSIYRPEKPLASIIIPTKDNPEAFIQSLVDALAQDYIKFEVIVADSGNTPIKKIVDEARKQTDVPIKYLYFPNKGNYTLAEARNRAIIESEGETLVFCDDRIGMEKDAVTEMSKFLTAKSWVWGVKDGVAKGFVENFSAVQRNEIVKHGLFNERMQWYGGMTQDIRTRFERELGFDFVIADTAKAKGIKRAKSKRGRLENILEAKVLLFKLYGE